MRVVGIIQARMSSTRLPGKVLMPVSGTTSMLELIIKRLAGARVDEWWVATTSSDEDDPVAELATGLGLRVHRGNVEDVLARFVTILEEVEADWVVRVTADCPLVDSVITNLLVETAASARREVTVISQVYDDPAEKHLRWAPLGYVPEIARTEAVIRSAAQIPPSEPYHRTHVLTWLYGLRSFQPASRPERWTAHPEWRWTVDTAADLKFVRALASQLGPSLDSAGYLEVAEVLEAEPRISRINAQVKAKPLQAG